MNSRCSTCSLARFCVPGTMSHHDAEKVDTLVTKQIRVKKGTVLYSLGDPVDAIYAIRLGTLKSHVATEDGRSQIVGFHLQGEVVGLDSLLLPRHASYCTALEDTTLCVMHVGALHSLADDVPALRRQLLLSMSREAQHDRTMLTTLGLMSAEERLIAFLIKLSERLSARGFAASEFILRMSREEIGSYLGLKLETISRLFSRLADAGLLEVNHRRVKLVNMTSLRATYDRSKSAVPQPNEEKIQRERMPA